MATWAWADASVGVIYPKLSDPYKQLFEIVIDGIEYEMGKKLDRYPLTEGFDAGQVNEAIRYRGNSVVLALGQRGIDGARMLDDDITVVAGAIMPASIAGADRATTGIVLVPDPELVFRRLLAFAPAIGTISVVYNPDVSQMLVTSARAAADRLHLKLDVREARDLREAALQYKALLESIDAKTQGIWLLHDPSTLDSYTILSSILQQAWSRRLVVFSSNLVHVKMGALFAMYPDNFEMGRDLGRLAKAASASRAERSGFTALRSLKIAVNKRTASHLRIGLSDTELKFFDLVYPMP